MMNDRDYWTKRYLELKLRGERSSVLFEQQTIDVIDQINTQLNREIISWYKRYAKADKTDFTTTAQILKKAHSSDWRMTLEEFRRLAIAGDKTTQLDLQYFESQVKRLELLQQQLQSMITPNVPQMQQAFGSSLETTYSDTYLHASYLNSAVTGAGMESFATFNERAVKLAVDRPWAPDGKDFSRRLWGNMVEQLPKILTQKVTEGLILGHSSRKMAHELSRADASFNEDNIHRLIHSEMAHVVEEATGQSYEDTGVEKYRYLATLESRTCPICGELDNQVFLLSERKPGINYPTIHVWCRCTTVAVIDSWPPHGKRWSKDPVTGKKKLVDNMSFNEWKSGYDLLTKQEHVAEPTVNSNVTVPKNIQAHTSQAAEHVIANTPFLKRVFENQKLNIAYDEETFFGRNEIIGATPRGTGKLIHLNPLHYRSETALKDYMNSDRFVKVKPSQFRKYPVVHELGHVFHNELYAEYQKNHPDTQLTRSDFIDGELKKIYTNYEKMYGEKVTPGKLPSLYAKEGPAEAFAELFTLNKLGRNSKWATVMDQYLKEAR